MSVFIHNNVIHGPEEEHIPAHLSFGQFVFDKLKKGGNKTALICAETGSSMTYNEILQKSVNLAISLKKLGLQKGDVVAVSSENRFEFIIAISAVTFCGGVLSLLNITYTPDEITHILNISKPKILFSSPVTAQNVYDCTKDLPYVEKIILFGEYDVVPAIMFETLIVEHVNVDDLILADVNGMVDTLAIMCSSGTTGLPKGVMLTHVNILTLCRHMKYYLDTSQQKKNHNVNVCLSLIPWFHAYGLLTTLSVIALNLEIVFLVRFEEQQYLETIQKYKVNMTTLVPPLAIFLAKHPLVLKYDLKSLHEVWCGSAPLSKEIQKAVTERTGIGYIKQGYGLTEVTMACCVDVTSDGAKIGSCGTPAPGMKVKVTDIESGKKLGPRQEGELCIKSPLQMKGYMGNQAAGDALIDDEGYLRTGDIGYYDEDGFIYIIDRLKELIKYKGYQVAPAELEKILLQHPGVAACGVVGTPDELAGELPTAFVTKQPGANVTEQELVKHVASKVSSAKHLRGGVIFIDDIPKNASGKVLRRELKKMLKPKSKL